jgi:hypothetical protein
MSIAVLVLAMLTGMMRPVKAQDTSDAAQPFDYGTPIRTESPRETFTTPRA